MNKELEIIIAGKVGTGKSTMMVILEQFLIEKGFDVELDLETEIVDCDSEAKFRELVSKYVTEREKSLMKTVKIKIRTEQLTNSDIKYGSPEKIKSQS